MKKTLKIVGLAALSAAMLLASCKQESSVPENVIVAKAYPGYNKIVVDGTLGSGFKIAVYRDDGKVLYSSEGNIFRDSDVEDGKDYTYTAVYGVNNGSGWSNYYGNVNWEGEVTGTVSATVKAIKPPYLKEDGTRTTALDLVNYEEDGNSDYVVTKDNIKVYREDSSIWGVDVKIEVPQKEYLTYKVELYAGNSVDGFPLKVYPVYTSAKQDPDGGDWDVDCSGDTLNTYPNRYRSAMPSEGKIKRYTGFIGNNEKEDITYSVKVTVKADGYADSEIIAKETLKVPAKTAKILTDFSGHTYDVHLSAISADGTKVTVTWTPAKKNDDNKTAYGKDKYEVWSEDTVTAMFNKLNVTITENADNKNYEAELKLDDVKGKKILIVLKDDGKYEYDNVDSVPNIY